MRSTPTQLYFYEIIICRAYSLYRNTTYYMIILYPYCHIAFLKIFKPSTVEPRYSGRPLQQTPQCKGHFLQEHIELQ